MYRIALFVRLALVMGLSWFMEIISYLAVGDKNTPYFMITDVFNTLQGVVIFIIFVLNGRVLGLIKKRFFDRIL